MFWNHRLMRRIEGTQSLLFVVEVYYNEDDNTIIGWTEKESIWGDEEYDGVAGIRQGLHWMLDATEKPILDEASLLAELAERPPEDLGQVETFATIEEMFAALDRVEEEDNE